MFPLVLGLGLLAGNEMLRQYKNKTRDEELATQYRGLLGQAGTDTMGPPTETGAMGHVPGTGLLADASNPMNQLKFAAGVAGLPGQQAQGLQLLNAAMQRAQQQQQFEVGSGQWERGFNRQVGQDVQAQSNWNQSFGLQQSEAQRAADQFRQTFGLQQTEAQRGADQWKADYGLRLRADQRAQAAANADAQGGPALPKLSAGYMWRPDGQGGAIAAPVPGTPDYAKGVQGLETLQAADERIGTMLDMIEGKETTLRSGKRVRMGGVGSEMWGENAARYSTLRGQVISDVAALRNMGVLQAGELERIEEALPDPTAWGSALRSNKSMGRGYQELRDQFRRKRGEHLNANPWLVPPMPPGFQPKQ